MTNLCTVRENEPTNLPHGALHLLTRFASVLYPVPSYASIWISASRAVALIRQEAVRAAVPFYASIRCHFMFQVTPAAVVPSLLVLLASGGIERRNVQEPLSVTTRYAGHWQQRGHQSCEGVRLAQSGDREFRYSS